MIPLMIAGALIGGGQKAFQAYTQNSQVGDTVDAMVAKSEEDFNNQFVRWFENSRQKGLEIESAKRKTGRQHDFKTGKLLVALGDKNITGATAGRLIVSSLMGRDLDLGALETKQEGQELSNQFGFKNIDQNRMNTIKGARSYAEENTIGWLEGTMNVTSGALSGASMGASMGASLSKAFPGSPASSASADMLSHIRSLPSYG